MSQLFVALDRSVGVEPAGLVSEWNGDRDASAIGLAKVEMGGGAEFLPGALELVVVPLAVNLASSAVYDLIRRLVRGQQRGRDSSWTIDILERTTSAGDRVVVVRSRKVAP